MRQRANPGRQGLLRIIGGQWRGRKLPFPAVQDLRPTTDRTRETLFNWLALELPGAHCLDLFAGSGALGLEALSRGAASCHFYETDKLAASTLSKHLEVLGASDRGHVIHGNSLAALPQHRDIDIAFIDPPFALFSAPTLANDLLQQGCLAEHASVYIEMPKTTDLAALDACFTIHREKTAGDVRYALLHYDPDAQATPTTAAR
jgi:16S rRNA (guanine966-N2)-methyltransferase